MKETEAIEQNMEQLLELLRLTEQQMEQNDQVLREIKQATWDEWVTILRYKVGWAMENNQLLREIKHSFARTPDYIPWRLR